MGGSEYAHDLPSLNREARSAVGLPWPIGLDARSKERLDGRKETDQAVRSVEVFLTEEEEFWRLEKSVSKPSCLRAAPRT